MPSLIKIEKIIKWYTFVAVNTFGAIVYSTNLFARVNVYVHDFFVMCDTLDEG